MSQIGWLLGYGRGWFPWIGLALISSLISLAVASRKLYRDCQALPFFNPFGLIGVWWWVIVHLALPAACFWLLYSLSAQPEINVDLFTKAIGFGLVFTALVNAYVDTGFYGIPLDAFYAFLTKLAYDQIAASQTEKSAAFWTDVENELLQNPAQMAQGLNPYLKNYFENDVSLSQEEKNSRLSEIEQALLLTSRDEMIAVTMRLLKNIRRRDLPQALKRFNCGDQLLTHYFPRWAKRRPQVRR
jgi:hypothetical protein